MEEKIRWFVRQVAGLRYEITCEKCGYTFMSREIIAKKACPACGAVYADRDTTYVIDDAGKIVEKKKEGDG